LPAAFAVAQRQSFFQSQPNPTAHDAPRRAL